MLNAAAESLIAFRFFPIAACVRVVIIPPFPFQHSALIRFLCRNEKGASPHRNRPFSTTLVPNVRKWPEEIRKAKGLPSSSQRSARMGMQRQALAYSPVESVSLWLFSGYRIPLELNATKDGACFCFVFICLRLNGRAGFFDTRFADSANALP
jgi:hypothetical protein